MANAFGQTSPGTFDPKPSNIDIRAGFVFGLYQAVKDISSTYGAIGLDYHLPNARGRELTLSVDRIFRSFSGSNGSMTMLTGNVKTPFRAGAADHHYWLVGIGAANQNFTSGSVVFAARYGVGMDLTGQVFAELVGTYTSPGRDKIQGNTAGIYFGYHF